MDIIHNKIYATQGEPVNIAYTITGTLLEGYDKVEMHLRGKNFSRDIDLTIDVENSMCRLDLDTEDLEPLRYYYDISGINKQGKRIPFTDHPMYLEVLPCL